MDEYFELRSELLGILTDLEKRVDYLEYLEDKNPANNKFKSGEESTQKLKDYIAIHGSMDVIDVMKVLKVSNRRKAVFAMKKAVELNPDDLYLFKKGQDGKITKLLPIIDSDFFKEHFRIVE
jgi:hypothetical protein